MVISVTSGILPASMSGTPVGENKAILARARDQRRAEEYMVQQEMEKRRVIEIATGKGQFLSTVA